MLSLVRGIQSRPSYANGFAPRNDMPLHPSLRTRIVGVWAPFLGNTGVNLWDWGGRKRNGILTNTPTWETSQFGPALLFDANSERVVVTTNALPVTNCTVMQFVKTLDVSPTFGAYGSDATNGWASFGSNFDPARWQLRLQVGGVDFGRETGFEIAENVWTSLTFTIAPVVAANTDIKLYINGVQKDSGDDADDPFQPTGQWWIGSRFGAFNANQQTSVMAVWNGVLAPSEIRTVIDPHALFRMKQRAAPKAPAPAVGNPWYYYAQQAS